MRRSTYFDRVEFPRAIIQSAYHTYFSKLDDSGKKRKPMDLSVKRTNEKLCFDRIEEFFAAIPDILFRFDHIGNDRRLLIEKKGSRVFVCVESPELKEINDIFEIFEKNYEKYKLEPEIPRIFIGHGHSPRWRILKEHLQDQHKLDVLTYEDATAAGLSIQEVLENMLDSSSIAFLVLTGEDIKNNNELHARENVIHELGLFQGRLGFNRGIILLEKGVTEFSNILGQNQIRFSKNNIRETFGDVLAVIGREFGVH